MTKPTLKVLTAIAVAVSLAVASGYTYAANGFFGRFNNSGSRFMNNSRFSNFQQQNNMMDFSGVCEMALSRFDSRVEMLERYVERYEQRKADVMAMVEELKAQGYDTAELEAGIVEVDQMIQELIAEVEQLVDDWSARKDELDCTDQEAVMAAVDDLMADVQYVMGRVREIAMKIRELSALVREMN